MVTAAAAASEPDHPRSDDDRGSTMTIEELGLAQVSERALGSEAHAIDDLGLQGEMSPLLFHRPGVYV